jgi:hypothetical protein
MKYAQFDPDYLKKAAYIIVEVYSISTGTKLAQAPVISKASV